MARVFLNDKEITKSDNIKLRESDSFVVIDYIGHTDDIKKKYADELRLLKEFGKLIMNATLSDTIINNWVLGRKYYSAKNTSLTAKKYTFIEAYSLLKNYSFTKNHPIDVYNLVVFAFSLAKQGSQTFVNVDSEESLTVLLLPSEYSNSMIYYNELNHDAKEKFRGYLALAFYDLGIKYVPVVITDGFRTAETQVKRILDRKLKYYEDKLPKNKRSYPYIKTLYDIYESPMKQNIDVVLQKSTIPEDAKKIIKANYGDLKKTLEILIPNHFVPSYHMFGQAVDLRNRDNHKDTAHTIIEKANQVYDSDHVHLNLE